MKKDTVDLILSLFFHSLKVRELRYVMNISLFFRFLQRLKVFFQLNRKQQRFNRFILKRHLKLIKFRNFVIIYNTKYAEDF